LWRVFAHISDISDARARAYPREKTNFNNARTKRCKDVKGTAQETDVTVMIADPLR
jgi:hypothetical protein